FVDDAQFARTGGDESVLRLLTDLWARAQAEGWPVLLIATHWEREWWNVEADNGNATFAAHFRSFVNAGQGGLALSLGREPALATLVQAGLGDLSDADVELLLDRADGNPQLLLEIVERARRSPAWREAGGGLSEAGRRQLATARFELHELIRQRMESDDTPDSVRRAMAVSSVQGVEFSCAVAERAGSLLHAEHVRQGLEVAERPHRYVQGVDRGVAGFLQRAYRDAALSLVDGQFGSSDDVAAALLKATAEPLGEPVRRHGVGEAAQDAVLSLRVSLSESSPDESGRRKAASAIVQCVRRALESTPSDMPRAATWAQRFQAGVEDGRWDSSLLDTEDLSTVESTLRYWLGEGVALRMSQDLASRLREMSDAGEGVSSHLIIALWNVAAGLRSEGRAGEADTTSAEALSLARAQYAADPSRENRRLLQVSLERHGVVQAILADTEQAEQCYREMLDLVEWGIAHDAGAADPEDVATHVHALLA